MKNKAPLIHYLLSDLDGWVFLSDSLRPSLSLGLRDLYRFEELDLGGLASRNCFGKSVKDLGNGASCTGGGGGLGGGGGRLRETLFDELGC
jgi:hypothetical protein